MQDQLLAVIRAHLPIRVSDGEIHLSITTYLGMSHHLRRVGKALSPNHLVIVPRNTTAAMEDYC